MSRRPHPRVLLAFLCISLAPLAQARCVLTDESPDARAHWKSSGFAVTDAADRGRRARALVECLDETDPMLRDGIAFEALSLWMRGKQLDLDTLRSLQARLFEQLDGPDTSGFRKPFAALVLAEVARTDRVQPWMTAEERERMATAAAAYLSSIRDYRGYVDHEGWRHGVAHGADWALQLVLNKTVAPAQVRSLLTAVGSQIMPADGHAYGFGEPARLARPVAYAAARGGVGQADIDTWLAGLVASLGPRPEGDQQAIWWARRANLENFLNALAALSSDDPSPPVAALDASVRKTMQQLP